MVLLKYIKYYIAFHIPQSQYFQYFTCKIFPKWSKNMFKVNSQLHHSFLKQRFVERVVDVSPKSGAVHSFVPLVYYYSTWRGSCPSKFGPWHLRNAPFWKMNGIFTSKTLAVQYNPTHFCNTTGHVDIIPEEVGDHDHISHNFTERHPNIYFFYFVSLRSTMNKLQPKVNSVIVCVTVLYYYGHSPVLECPLTNIGNIGECLF